MSGTSIVDRDEALELAVSEWLQDGPYTAPAAGVEAVLAEVRRLPAPNRPLDRLRRLVVGARPGDLFEVGHRPLTGRWLAFGVVTVIVVGSLALFGLPSIGPTVPAPSPSPTPGASPRGQSTLRPSPSALASLARLPVSVTGSSVCSTQEEGTSVHGTTAIVTSGIVVRCFDRASDPRAAGLGYRYYTTEVYPDDSQRWYGTATRSGDGNGWSGIFLGTKPSGSAYLTLTTFWLGTGGYAGLEIRDQVRMQVEEGSIDILESVLEVVGPVSDSGALTCSANGVGTLTCWAEANDVRLGATWTLQLKATQRADGTSSLAGTCRIANPAGEWSGTATGTLAADGRTYLLDTTLTGSGLYAGFSVQGSLTGPLDALLLADTVTPVR